MKTVAVIGASADRGKFGNMAVRAFLNQGWAVMPINPRETTIEGLTVYRSVAEAPGSIDLATFYVPPPRGLQVIEEVAARGIGEVWLNPGADSPELVARAEALGLKVVVACSLVRLGEFPAAE